MAKTDDKRCGSCGGSGKLVLPPKPPKPIHSCPTCHTQCPRCAKHIDHAPATTTERCLACNGRGISAPRVECNECSGYGFREVPVYKAPDFEWCSSCAGTGRGTLTPDERQAAEWEINRLAHEAAAAEEKELDRLLKSKGLRE